MGKKKTAFQKIRSELKRSSKIAGGELARVGRRIERPTLKKIKTKKIIRRKGKKKKVKIITVRKRRSVEKTLLSVGGFLR